MTTPKLENALNTCHIFVERALGIKRNDAAGSTQLVAALLTAASHNTYVETVSDKADTLNRHVKTSLPSMMLHAYLEQTTRCSRIKNWPSRPVMLAFDYTEENFYGDVQGVDIHGWTGKEGVKGKFKFLTCSIVSDEIPEKIPLLSVPIHLGHYKSQVILYMLSLLTPLLGHLDLVLFDRGFWDNDLMIELNHHDYPYLIFVPKQRDKKEKLLELDEGDCATICEAFTRKRYRTVEHDERYIIFMRQIYNEKNDEKYDWIFATNIDEVAFGNLIGTYKKRWRIETGFRVQDEAAIKCKSTDLQTRYFLFLFTQLLQADWMCYYKNEVSFKRFLIDLDTYAQTHLPRRL